MKIVIDIPEEEYKRIIDGKWEGNPLADYIENGTPLRECLDIKMTEEEIEKFKDAMQKANRQLYTITSDTFVEGASAERPHGEWIPVSERLPDLFEIVLVTDEIHKVFEYERRPLDEEGNVCEKWTFLGRNIIAWMPLPEPYKGAENERRY